MSQPTPRPKVELHEALWHRLGQSKAATFDQLRQWSVAEIATYHLQGKNPGVFEWIEHLQAAGGGERSHENRPTWRALKRLLDSAPNGSRRRPIRRQVGLTGPLHASRSRLPLFAAWAGNGRFEAVDPADTVERDRRLASLSKEEWNSYRPSSKCAPSEFFVHPSSCIYEFDAASRTHAECSIVLLHLAELLCRMCSSLDRDMRAAARTFRCTQAFSTANAESAEEAADRCKPDAVYTYREYEREIYFPIAFSRWSEAEIFVFVQRLQRRLYGQHYCICLPGLQSKMSGQKEVLSGPPPVREA